jgi:hypothetical protein
MQYSNKVVKYAEIARLCSESSPQGFSPPYSVTELEDAVQIYGWISLVEAKIRQCSSFGVSAAT